MTTFTLPPTAPTTADPSTFATRADAYIAWIAQNCTDMVQFQAALSILAVGSAFAIQYTVDSATADADPGAGKLRFDNFAAQTSATTVRLDTQDPAGTDWTALLNTFDASTSTVKGRVRLVKLGDPSKWLNAQLTAKAAPTGYFNLTIANVLGSSAAPFILGDSVVLIFTPTGDKGDTGLQGPASGQTTTRRATNTIITNANKSQCIVATAAYTQTLDPIANFDADFVVYLEQADGIDGTLDPNASEQVDGRTTIPMYGTGRILLRKNSAGTAWETVPVKPFFKRWTTSNASAPTATGYKKQGRRAIGGGGSGGSGGGGGSGAGSGNQGGGGGAGGGAGSNGATEERVIDTSIMGATEAVVVGAGGAAPASVGTGGAGVTSVTPSGNPGLVGTSGSAGGTSSSGAGTYGACTGNGGNAGNGGTAGNFGNAGGNGASSAATAGGLAAGSSALGSNDAVDRLGTAGGTSQGGSAGTSTQGSKGGDGGVPGASYYDTASTALTAATGGPAQTVVGSAGNNGSAASAATAPGQGGPGGGGGSGTRGGANASSSGKAGDGGLGGRGADGCVEWWGVL